jgi:Flp pilus assembly pilin Flp
VTTAIRHVFNDDAGQGLAEYGLILSLVALACVGALTALAGGINNALTIVTAAL